MARSHAASNACAYNFTMEGSSASSSSTISRFQDHCPHPRRKPDHRLVVRDRAVLCDLRQDLRVGDCPALEKEVTSLLLDENQILRAGQARPGV